MNEGNWVMIYSSPDSFRAELIKGLLDEHGIECVSVNKKDSAYLYGEIELYVRTENAFEANILIRNRNISSP